MNKLVAFLLIAIVISIAAYHIYWNHVDDIKAAIVLSSSNMKSLVKQTDGPGDIDKLNLVESTKYTGVDVLTTGDYTKQDAVPVYYPPEHNPQTTDINLTGYITDKNHKGALPHMLSLQVDEREGFRTNRIDTPQANVSKNFTQTRRDGFDNPTEPQPTRPSTMVVPTTIGDFIANERDRLVDSLNLTHPPSTSCL
jgi:hypothetical protein